MTPLPDGWLTEDEGTELMRLAEGKVVLELGSYKGRSTVVLARTAASVVSIDLHKPFRWYDEEYDDTLDEYFRNVRHFQNLSSIVGSFESARLFQHDAFGLVFVDGLHDEKNAVADLAIALEFEAVLAVHDWGRYDLPKVARKMDLRPDYVVDSIAVWTA